MLDVLDGILLTIKAAGGKISGRTAIQKLVYFESIFKLVDANYRPYYYGPYSSELAGKIETAISLRFVQENVCVFVADAQNSIEHKLYEYSLTEDGKSLSKQLEKENEDDYKKITKIVNICKTISNLDVNTLSYAAKINFILTSKKKSMTSKEIAEAANSYGWQLSKPQIEESKDLLKALHLCKET